MKDPKFFSKADLERRGWTETLRERFGLVHDREAPNPYGADKANMKLYSKKKVFEIEQTPGFQKALEWSTWFRGHMTEVARKRREA